MMKRLLPYGLALLSGCLLSLSFPRWEFYLLAWIALIPLFFAIQNRSVSKAFLLGWIAGVAYFGGTLSWVTISMHNYGGVSWMISTLLMFLLVSYLAIYVGLFATLLQCIRQSNRQTSLLFAPAAWTTLEYIRGHLFTGFPWSNLGYSQYRFLPAIQIADIGSVYAVGFVLVLVNAALFTTLRAGWVEHRTAVREIVAALSVTFLTFSYGAVRLSQPMGEDRSLSVAVVQGNIDQHQKWDAGFREETVRTYKRLSLSSLQQGPGSKPELVIWPEAATPFFFEEEPIYRNELWDLSREGGFHLLFGSPASITTPSGEISLLNSAYLLSPKTDVFSRYDKRHLVPFGEYVPLSSLLFFVNKMVEGIGDFIAGREATIMETASTKIGTVICFEVIFPEEVRLYVKNGAALMTTITNDAWFGKSAAPYQHFSMVVFRAIENRVPFARAANTGISGFINAYGTITKQTPLFVEATLSDRLHPGNQKTFYTAFGDLFAVACVIMMLAFLLTEWVKRRKSNAH
ncbi:MAG: apolipoprotein N-acyltransferase [Nitrospiria bacterium]